MIKKYKKLMLRRINWQSVNEKVDKNGDGSMDIDEVKESTNGECVLVWEGIQKKKSFEKWKLTDIRTEHDAKRILGEKRLEHVWSAVQSFQTMRAQGEQAEDVEKLLK